MNTPQVKIDIGDNGVIYIELSEAVPEDLMDYIKALASSFLGERATFSTKNKIEQAINSNLVQLTNTGQLIKNSDGTWDVRGFLWAP